MRLLKHTVFLLFISSLSILSQTTKIDSILKTLSTDQKIAQLFIVMDSISVDSTVINTLPAPTFFIFSGGKIGNLRKAKNIESNHSIVVCEIKNGMINGINNQTIPSNNLLEASQLGGNTTNYLPYLAQKAKKAGAFSFCFDFTTPWIKDIDFKALYKSKNRFISTEYPAQKGLTLYGKNGFSYIDIFPFPANLFESISQVPIKTEPSPTIDEGLPKIDFKSKTLLSNILNGEGLLFTTDYQRDFNLLKEVINNNLLPISELNKAAKRSLIAKFDNYNTSSFKESIDESLDEISIARQGVTLISNDRLFLPLQSIDTLKAVVLTLGEGNFDKMTSAIKFYLPNCHSLTLSTLDSTSISQIANNTLNSNLIILAYDKSSASALKNITYLNALKQITGSKSTILISFNSSNDLLLAKDNLPLKATIEAYENTNFTQQIAAENLFGGGGFMGKSPFVVKGYCDKGQGITNLPTKLGKAMPSEVEMNGEILSKIDDVVSYGMQAHAMPGCQVLIARKGKIIFQKAYGYDNYDNENAITDTTLYDIASVTKIMASLPMIMKLTDEGTINVDTTLQTYLPYLKSTNKGNLKLIEVLTHQAGLTSFIPFYQNIIDKSLTDGNIFSNKYNDKYSIKVDDRLFFNRYAIYRTDIISTTQSDTYSVHVARDLFMNKSYIDSMYAQIDSSNVRTRGKYVYSDCGYYYFKKIIEQHGSHSLDTLLSSNYLQPLGLYRTTYNPLNKFPLNQIAPTEQDLMFRKQTIRGFAHDPGAAMLGGVGGHAGLFSTASDLAVMMQMYLNGGTYGGKRYISENTLKRFTTQVYPNSRRGIGFDKREPNPKKINPVSDYCSPQSFGHSGFTGTLVWADPKYDLVYIFLSNRISPNAYNKKLIKMDIRSKIQDIIYQSIIQ